MNEFNRENRLSFLGFYARRGAKRILPAATIVIVGTVLARGSGTRRCGCAAM